MVCLGDASRASPARIRVLQVGGGGQAFGCNCGPNGGPRLAKTRGPHKGFCASRSQPRSHPTATPDTTRGGGRGDESGATSKKKRKPKPGDWERLSLSPSKIPKKHQLYAVVQVLKLPSGGQLGYRAAGGQRVDRI